MLFVREITSEEQKQLLLIARKNTDGVKVRRAQIVLASAQGLKVPAISERYQASPEHIRLVIKAFNTEGLVSLNPRYGGGHPPVFTEEQRAQIIDLAQTPPQTLGYPFSTWSLSKLKQVLLERRIVEAISIETIRKIVREANISYQHTKTWKASTDPAFSEKKGLKRSTSVRQKTDGFFV